METIIAIWQVLILAWAVFGLFNLFRGLAAPTYEAWTFALSMAGISAVWIVLGLTKIEVYQLREAVNALQLFGG